MPKGKTVLREVNLQRVEVRPLVYYITTSYKGKMVQALVKLGEQKEFCERVIVDLGIKPVEAASFQTILDNLFWINIPSLAESLPGIQREVIHPITGFKERLYDVIINLNDETDWTREKIADWIESLDDAPKFEVK